MSSTAYWTWTVDFDQPGTGRRITAQGETIAPAAATEQDIRDRLYPELTKEICRRYGAGYSIEGLSPSCRFDRK